MIVVHKIIEALQSLPEPRRAPVLAASGILATAGITPFKA